MGVWDGSCHCGLVTFRVDGEVEEITSCDCSLCRRKNALMAKVHESALTVTSGEDALSEYRWNTGVARHFFCGRCGIYTFHRKRSAPDHYGVNVMCLEGFDPGAFPHRAADGVDMTVIGPARGRSGLGRASARSP